ncbi:MAG: hypothetical protein ACLGRW_07005 [Acidobacteriota bacterium]
MQQTLPNLPGSHANNRLFLGVEVLVPSKDIYTDITLLDLSSPAGQSFFDDVAQKRLASMTVGEGAAFQKLPEMEANPFPILIGEVGFLFGCL